MKLRLDKGKGEKKKERKKPVDVVTESRLRWLTTCDRDSFFVMQFLLYFISFLRAFDCFIALSFELLNCWNVL